MEVIAQQNRQNAALTVLIERQATTIAVLEKRIAELESAGG